MSTTGWAEIDLTTVSTQMEVLPEGEYTFQILPGAKFSDRDAGKVEFQAAVAAGEHAGRRVFLSYPNPAEYDWAPRQFKRMVEVLGADIQKGEGPTEYLNRVQGLRFGAPVIHKIDSQGVTRANVNLSKVKAAA